MSTLLERLDEKIDLDLDGCWTWTASTIQSGYGHIRVGDRAPLAHRVLYELVVEPVPAGLQIDHLCRNRACVNPDHMELVTHAENVRRGTQGEWQKSKTHCPSGHAYTPENTYVNPQGHRSCRACRSRNADTHTW